MMQYSLLLGCMYTLPEFNMQYDEWSMLRVGTIQEEENATIVKWRHNELLLDLRSTEQTDTI